MTYSGTTLYSEYTDEKSYDELLIVAAAEVNEKGSYNWKAFDPDPANEKGNRYPLFRYHEAYEAAGYNCLNWSISGQEDWEEMDKVAIGPDDPVVNEVNIGTEEEPKMITVTKKDYIDADGNYFDGVTFHLTDDIDFNQDNTGVDGAAAVEYTDYMWPMGANEDDSPRFFAGTINGHKNAFKDVYIRTIKSTSTGGRASTTPNYSGLFYYLGDCKIIDFGIDSGTVATGSSDTYGGLSSYGAIYTGKTAEFEHVWFSAKLAGVSGGITNAVAGFYSTKTIAPTGILKVNGFVFDGTFAGKTASSNTTSERNAFYGVAGGNVYTFPAASTYSNIISYPQVSKSSYTYLFGGTADGIVGTATNIYGALKAGQNSAENNGLVAGTGLAYDYRATAASINTKSGTNIAGANLTPSFLTTMTALEAAHDSNGKQAGAEDPVYFTLDGSKIRPYGTADNKIVKLTINSVKDGEDQPAMVDYYNKGTTVTKEKLAKLLDVNEAAIVDVKVGDVSVDLSTFALSADATSIDVSINSMLAVQNVWGKYSALVEYTEYLTPEATTALENFQEAVSNATADTADGVLGMEDGLKAALATYEGVEEADGKMMPGYDLVDTLKDFNKNNVWAVRTTDDWVRMVNASKLVDGAEQETFEDHIIHILESVDFAKVTDLEPLCFGNGKNDQLPGGFKGTIEGHGNSFRNVNISVVANDEKAAWVVGLIGKISRLARINNFGVDSGKIELTGDAKDAYVATFGEAFHLEEITGGAVFNRVWSGVDLVVNTSGGDYALGLIASGGASKVEMNGGYYYGNMTAGKSWGIFDRLRDGEKFSNIVSAPTIAEGNQYAAMYHIYDTANKKTSFTLINNFSVGGIIHADLVKDGATLNATETNVAPVDSADIGAYNVNIAQNPADENAVYFTKTETGLRPTGVYANRVVKFTLQVNEKTPVDVYENVNNLEAVVPNGAELVSITAADGTDLTATPEAIDGDVTVVVSLGESEEEINNLKAQLEEKIAEVEALLPDINYFKTSESGEIAEGEIDMNDWLGLAKSEKTGEALIDDLEAALAHDTNGTLVLEITEVYTNLPKFDDHAKFEAYQPEGNANWLIVDEDDWKEMDAVATNATVDDRYVDAETGKYFEGITFHLKGNVQFDYSNDRLPLGAYGDPAKNTARYFSGIIDGHGYGFENIYIQVVSGQVGATSATNYYPGNSSFGLFAYLGGCEIRNFGINSGWIAAGTGNGQQSASTFGAVPDGATSAQDKLILENVWNNGWLVSLANTGISGLFGTYGRHNTYTIYADVDGAVIDGTLIQSEDHSYPMVAGLVGGFATKLSVEGLTFSNVIVSADMGFGTVKKGETPAENKCTFGTTCAKGAAIENKHVTMLALDEAATYDADKFTNVYGIQGGKADNKKVLSGAVVANTHYKDQQDSVVIPGFDPLLKANVTGFEAALEMNTTEHDGVYFKIDAKGNLRPTTSATNKLVEVEVTIGEETKTAYINSNQAYDNEALKEALGYGIETTITSVEVTSGGAYVEGALTVTEDAAIVITLDVCEHPANVVSYVHIEGDTKHTMTCSGCGYTKTGSCTIVYAPGPVAEDGTSYHEATCPKCQEYYSEPCNGKDTKNPDNCEDQHTYEFECEVHTGVYPAGPGVPHDFESGEGWVYNEETKKETRKCPNCSVVESRIVGKVNADGITLTPKDSDVIVITLPEELATAELTFKFKGDGYTITMVNGTAWNGDVYTATTSTVTITIASDVTAVGGELTVFMTNAKDAEGTAITDDDATVVITFDGVHGDANGDGEVALGDALAALYAVAEKPGAEPINMANAEMNDDGVFDVQDVYEIVRIWLRKTLETM